MKKNLAIIPARYASTRFPGKPLININGKSMIRRVYEQAIKASKIHQVVVATDDERIFTHVQAFGGQVMMTDSSHQSGTDRCAEIIDNELFKNFEIIINIQGDEPFIAPSQINLLVDFLQKEKTIYIATLAKKIKNISVLLDPNTVKIVFGASQNALYFSRHPIPFLRQVPPNEYVKNHSFYKHIGLYAFKRTALSQIAQLAPTPLELAESLEQLRWLENGWQIGVALTDLESISIDTPEDLKQLKTG